MGVIHLWNISKWTRWQPIALINKHMNKLSFCFKHWYWQDRAVQLYRGWGENIHCQVQRWSGRVQDPGGWSYSQWRTNICRGSYGNMHREIQLTIEWFDDFRRSFYMSKRDLNLSSLIFFATSWGEQRILSFRKLNGNGDWNVLE